MTEAPDPKPEKKGLKSTLNLPQTPFPMKANLPLNEPARLKQWQQDDLYGQIRQARAGAPKYILHDGPPYANGAIHLGHALNKCIKDFIVKTKTMAGFDAPYVPGWDCHGLPIEIKVDEQLGRKKLEMDPLAVRQACRDYAARYVDLQRSQFERLGIFGQWNDPYLTMSNQYESKILETFYSFLEQGFVYNGLKPVFWCIHDRTALAEAEVEYERHTSPSVYVRYQLTSDPANIHPSLAGRNVYTIIWTTTPWTLPASQAIAFNPELDYVALGCPASGPPDVASAEAPVYLLAQALLSSVVTHCNLLSAANPAEPASAADIVALFPGSALEHATFHHPFFDRSILGVTAPYVTADQGTGAVHSAPAHGVDDFYTGKRYHLPDLQYVDDAGRQRHTGMEAFEGLTVFQSNAPIIELLRERGALLAANPFEHSYPHCWRCHKPVIVRATEQWFIRMDTPMPAPPPSAPGLDSETWASTETPPGAPGLDSETWASTETETPSGAPGLDSETWASTKTPSGAPGLDSETWASTSKETPSGAPGLDSETWASTSTETPSGAPGLDSETWASTETPSGAPGLDSETWASTKTPSGAPGLDSETRASTQTPSGAPGLDSETWASTQTPSGAPGLDSETWASTQTKTFRQRALAEIDKVTWDPAWGKERISNMIATRPDWCISRQRIWGVPIAVFLCDRCHEPLRDPALNRRIVELFAKESADAWYKYPADQLLPPGTACPCGAATFTKEMDILDVWFESGSSWHAVLEPDPALAFPADLYTEGGDQHRGWFHSSLLTSVAMRHRAPYKKVATSGWTLDEQGRAFSKSLGNGVDPVDIAKRLGGEIIRLWVASVDFREDVAASENLMQRVSDNYRKLRNTLRFLLSNLYDFLPAEHEVNFEAMQPLDQYILARLAEVDKKIRAAYDAFEFHRAYHALNEFTNTDLSALYLDVLKDRLYTFAPNHPGRRSAQTALWHIAEALTRLIAPILSFTAEEVWTLLPKVEGRVVSVHTAEFLNLTSCITGNASNILANWKLLLDGRDEAFGKLELLRSDKTIGKSSEASIRFQFPSNTNRKSLLAGIMSGRSKDYEELLGVSNVEFVYVEDHWDVSPYKVVATRAPGTKCERCWRYTADVGQDTPYPTVCLRCAEALHALHYPPYTAEATAEPQP